MLNIELHIEKNLREWAQWSAQQKEINMAPFCSSENKADNYTLFREKDRVPQENSCSNAIHETEKLIEELSHYQTLLADVIRANYTQTGTQNSKAKKLGISLAQFKFCIKLAKAWLCGYYGTVLANAGKVKRKTDYCD